MKTPTLETNRIILRALKESDSAAIQQYFPHWNIVQHLSTRVPWPYPKDGAKHFTEAALKSVEAGKKLIWAITLKGCKDECVGIIEYHFEDSDVGNRGFWIAQHLHGQGLMTEAISATQDYVLFELKVQKFRVANAINNPASRRIKEKTGAVHIGTEKLEFHSGCNEKEIWEITESNWRNFTTKGNR